MKYAIVIADGAGDKPLEQLGGRTALEAASTPNMDALARAGIVGTARTTPPGWSAGSDVCTMDLLGYDPRRYHTGRAPLEAAAIGMPMSPSDWAFRVNLITVGPDDAASPDNGLILDHSAGAIGDAEAATLFADLMSHWQRAEPTLAATLRLKHGVSYRAAMLDASASRYHDVRCTPPHEAPRQPWRTALPRAIDPLALPAAEGLERLVLASRQVLERHPINLARVARGQRPANLAWPWGQGTRPELPTFHQRYAMRGAMITAVDLLAGIANLIGWERLDVPGVTSYHDTDYVAQGSWACDALDRFDIVCCHVESPDEASHQADWATKVAGIEAIDRHVVGPLLTKLRGLGESTLWRMMVLPDHYTLVSTRKHDPTPVPFAIAGASITPGGALAYTEASAHASGLYLDEGHELMDFFLFGGLRRGPASPPRR
jgi:2,3-bisphosphoglycerate-independent phosphoglycerate mutase